MSADPVAIHDFGSDINPYAYVHGTPLMGVDPDGRFVFLIVIAVISSAPPSPRAPTSPYRPAPWVGTA